MMRVIPVSALLIGGSMGGIATMWKHDRNGVRLMCVRKLFRGGALAVMGWTLLAGAAAEAQQAEKVVAVVEEEPILLSEVLEQYEVFAAQGAVDTSDTSAARGLKRRILDQLIEDRLVILEAQSQGIQVSPEEVQQAVEQTIDDIVQGLGGRQAFLNQLRAEGLTEAELRERYRQDARRQLLANRLVQREIGSQVELTDEDVRRYFEENRDELPEKPMLTRISDIFIAVRPDSLIEARRREEAAELRQRIASGELEFEEAAEKFSDDPSSEVGGRLGRFRRGDFEPAFEQAAFDLEPGEISPPVRTRFGFHLIRLDEKDAQGEWAVVHHILLRLPPSRIDEARARERAEAIRQQLLEGESFAAMARTASDDTVAAARGGDLGWLPAGAFQGAVKQAVDTLQVGEVSEVVPGDGGFHILKVTGRQEPGEYTFEEIREDLREMVRRERLEEKYRAWIEDLRQKYYIEEYTLESL
ncbi:MAG: hypothetical protein GF355_13875 [Candidatus Eisenbacteria bacterium]|nr:hypothetical protein [Candidatus Eisenbacteria bacterium]